jgi:hypothetical protein
MGHLRNLLLLLFPFSLLAGETLQEKLEHSSTVVVFQVESHLTFAGGAGMSWNKTGPIPRGGPSTGWSHAVVSGQITRSFRGLLKPGPFAFVWKDRFTLTGGKVPTKEDPSAVVMQSPRKFVLFLRFLDAGDTVKRGHEFILYQGDQVSGDALPWTPELEEQIAGLLESLKK